MTSDNPKYDDLLDEATNAAEAMIETELGRLWEKYKNKFKKFEDEDEGAMGEDFVNFVTNNVYSAID